MPTTAPSPRKEMPPVKLERSEFTRRYMAQFADPAFDALRSELERVEATAWDGYINARKAPVTHKAGKFHRGPALSFSLQ